MRIARHLPIVEAIVRRAVMAAAWCIAAMPLAAQRPSCDSVARVATHGTGMDTLRITLRRGKGQERLDPRYAMGALDALRRHFVLPPRMALPFLVPVSDTHSTFGLIASLEFAATGDGAIRDARLVRSSYVEALDSALSAAVRGAGGEFAFRPVEAVDAAERTALVVDLTFGIEDTARAGMDVAELQQPRFGALVLPRAIEPQRLPSFPSASAAGGLLRGTVHMSFAVSRTGTVLPGTVEFSTVTSTALARGMLEVLPSWRFEPARLAGCPVAAIVSQRFSFVFPN